MAAGKFGHFCVAMLGGIVALELVATARAQDSPDDIDTITIVGVTPLRSGRLPAELVPGNVQRANSEDIARQHGLDLTEFLNASFGSVFINEAQSNPLQPDVLFRGFVASPLLGLPQGMSVYKDGVRINEPFGDTVNWVLIPEQAIAEIELVPGSNPLYGLNTLGGALSVQTKTGFTHPGTSAELSGGSFGRMVAQMETGGSGDGGLGYYLAGSYLDEVGWRAFSPSEVTQLFASVGSESDTASLDLSVSYIDTDLVGNGAAPIQLLAVDREAIYTRPDRTSNELAMVNLRASRQLGPVVSIDGVAYFRSSDIGTYNGDDSDFEECEAAPGFMCEEEDDGEELVFDEDGQPIPAGDEFEGGTVNHSSTEQAGYGTAVELVIAQVVGGRDNHLVIGASYDEAGVDFAASTELGALDGTRRAVGGGMFVGDAFTGLETTTRNFSIYAVDTWSIIDRVALTLSGRYNDTGIELRDQLGTELNGNHEFNRFNPAVALTWIVTDSVQIYGSFNESSRAPSPVELTCADEDDPCRLPNAFLADPPLEQVVAQSIEFGARGDIGNVNWHAGVFQTDNEQDILFISADTLTNEGYFDNVGDTRRRGFELSLRAHVFNERADWFMHYTWLDATFQQSFSVASPNNPAAIEGEIPVQPGDRLPGIPQNLLKLGGQFELTGRVSIGGELHYSSDRVYRGDEGNLVDPIPGYVVAILRADYRLNERFTIFALVDNLFDEQYATFGLFGEADEVLGGDFSDPRFISPGAPTGAWIGFRMTR